MTSLKKGFTLIELLVVISIIGLLSSVVLTSINTARSKARDARRISDMRQIQLAIELYQDTNKVYPQISGLATWHAQWDLLAALLQGGGFMANVPQDPQYNGTDTATYYYWYCTGGQQYRLLAKLEKYSIVLETDIDGNLYSDDSRCSDASGGYCLGTVSYCY